MLNLYNVNSLVHWEEREISMRDHMVRFFSDEVRHFLKSINSAWNFRRIEAPALMPRSLVSEAYVNTDIWVQEKLSSTETELVLRPETTPSTYVYMQHLLGNHSRTRLPLCSEEVSKQVRLAQAAKAQRDTSVSDLCKELDIERVTLYRYVGPKGRAQGSWKTPFRPTATAIEASE